MAWFGLLNRQFRWLPKVWNSDAAVGGEMEEIGWQEG
jgi:hypothetical protein